MKAPTRRFVTMMSPACGATLGTRAAVGSAPAEVPEIAAVDWSLRSRDGIWFLRGQATGSRADGGPPSRTLLDGTVIRRGDLGYGAFLSAGKQDGEPWRFELGWDYESPRLELNALGFQRTQNEQLGRAKLTYVRPSGGGPFHDWSVVLGGEQRYTTDGRGLSRATSLWLGSEVQLRELHRLGLFGYLDLPRWDVREVARSGVALRRQPTLAAGYDSYGTFLGGGISFLWSDMLGNHGFRITCFEYGTETDGQSGIYLAHAL